MPGGNGNSRDTGRALGEISSTGQPPKRLQVFAYGVARNRLLQAAKRLSVNIAIVDDLGEADAVVTLNVTVGKPVEVGSLLLEFDLLRRLPRSRDEQQRDGD